MDLSYNENKYHITQDLVDQSKQLTFLQNEYPNQIVNLSLFEDFIKLYSTKQEYFTKFDPEYLHQALTYFGIDTDSFHKYIYKNILKAEKKEIEKFFKSNFKKGAKWK